MEQHYSRCEAETHPSASHLTLREPAAWIPFFLSGLLLLSAALFWTHTGKLLVEQLRTRSRTAGQNTLSEAATVEASLSAVFTPEVLYWSDDIMRWSQEYNLDPNLIAVVMQIESCGYRGAVSPSGAMGLFQVMPFHFGSVDDPLDPDTNALRGLSYLARGVELSEGRPDLALAGYNGGHAQIDRSPTLWPQETRRYVIWGFGILGDIADGRDVSPVLEEWLAAGGSSLCMQAQQSLAFAGH